MAAPRIIVTGSREYQDRAFMRVVLTRIARALNTTSEPPVLVHGAARGADTLAAELWSEFGWPVEAHPAKWELLGPAAGHARNTDMAKLGADVCVAFPLGASPGTRDMMRVAREYGITLIDASEFKAEDLT